MTRAADAESGITLPYTIELKSDRIMRSAIAATLLFCSTPALAAAVFTPVHVAPVVHVAPTVRVNPAVHSHNPTLHGHSAIKSGTKDGRTVKNSRDIPVVIDTPTSGKCTDKQSDKDCAKR